MQKYIQVYFDYFRLETSDFIPCEACQKPAVEIHHIQGRGKDKDVISNLMALCRKCHVRAHSSKNYVSKEEFQYIHANFLQGNRKQFLR
jgi:predicted restriction endonuclease